MIHLEIVSDLQAIIRRDFPLAVRDLANPLSSNPLIDGEFMTLNTSYQLVRGTDGCLGWAAFAERGRFDVQAIGKVTVLYLQSYEADTKVYSSGGGGLTLGCKLQVKAGLTIDGVAGRVGLEVWGTGLVIGYCTRLPADNGQKLRFIQTLY